MSLFSKITNKNEASAKTEVTGSVDLNAMPVAPAASKGPGLINETNRVPLIAVALVAVAVLGIQSVSLKNFSKENEKRIKEVTRQEVQAEGKKTNVLGQISEALKAVDTRLQEVVGAARKDVTDAHERDIAALTQRIDQLEKDLQAMRSAPPPSSPKKGGKAPKRRR